MLWSILKSEVCWFFSTTERYFLISRWNNFDFSKRAKIFFFSWEENLGEKKPKKKINSESRTRSHWLENFDSDARLADWFVWRNKWFCSLFFLSSFDPILVHTPLFFEISFLFRLPHSATVHFWDLTFCIKKCRLRQYQHSNL